MSPAMYDLFFLLGDSITEQGYNQDLGFGWTAALSNAYIRRLAVVNMGLSGYSTDKVLSKLPEIIPDPSRSRIRLMTIFFGANDARLPNTPGGPQQHVNIDDYRANLKKIATHPLVQAHNPKIIVITPPPVDERMCLENDGTNQVRRPANVTASYAQAAKEVGQELGVTVLDAWSTFMRRAGWKPGDESLIGSKDAPQDTKSGLPALLRDGLHLSGEGNKLLFEELMRVVEEAWPEETPARLPYVLPRWDDSEVWKSL